MTFAASGTASGTFSPSWAGLPVPGQICDSAANALPASYVNDTVPITSPPTLAISRAGTNVLLSWPYQAGTYNLQEATGALPPVGTWTNVPTAPALSNSQNVIALPLGKGLKFYRLSQ